jgi:hypothetical protein
MKKTAPKFLKKTSAALSGLNGLWLSPLVVAARMPVLMAEALNPDPSRRTETNRMVQEKVAATQEGIVAAQLALGQACMETFAALAFGQIPRTTPGNTADAMMQAGLAPAARKVKANIKRLTSTR